MNWIVRDQEAARLLGYIPAFLEPDDPRPAAEQFHERYAQGDGWAPIPGCEVTPNGNMIYPGDPPLAPIAFTVMPITGEKVLVYVAGIVAVVQPDGSFEVARLD